MERNGAQGAAVCSREQESSACVPLAPILLRQPELALPFRTHQLVATIGGVELLRSMRWPSFSNSCILLLRTSDASFHVRRNEPNAAFGETLRLVFPRRITQRHRVGRGAGVTHCGRGYVSTEPTSMRGPNTRRKHAPRWSCSAGGVFGSPASIAGLPRIGICVSVGPP